jgi:MFS family permease
MDVILLKKQPTIESVSEGPKLLNKYFFLISAVSIFSGLTLQFFNTTTSLYVKSLGGLASYTGMLLMLFTITATIVRILTGRMVDTIGRRKIIILGLLIFAAVSLAFTFFPYLGALPFLRFLQGIGYSMSATGISVAITDVIPKKRMGEGIGYFGLGNSLCQAIGPGLAMGLIIGGDFKPVFYVAAGSLVIAAILMLFCNYEKIGKNHRTQEPKAITAKGEESPAKPKVSSLWVFFERTAIPFTIISLFSSIAMSAMITFLMLYASNQKIANAGLYFTFSAICIVIARLVTGKITDRYGALYTLVPGFVLTMLGFICLIFSAAVPLLFYAAGMFAGFGGGMTGPALNAAVIKAAPDNRRGAASGTFMISYDVGFGIGGLLWGLVIDLAGFTALFAGCAIFTVIAMLISIIFLKKKADRRLGTPG